MGIGNKIEDLARSERVAKIMSKQLTRNQAMGLFAAGPAAATGISYNYQRKKQNPKYLNTTLWGAGGAWGGYTTARAFKHGQKLMSIEEIIDSKLGL